MLTQCSVVRRQELINGTVCLSVSAGACGVPVPHHFHSGGVPEGNSLRPALPPKRLPEERLESAGLHHRGRGVSELKCCLLVLSHTMKHITGK